MVPGLVLGGLGLWLWQKPRNQRELEGFKSDPLTQGATELFFFIRGWSRQQLHPCSSLSGSAVWEVACRVIYSTVPVNKITAQCQRASPLQTNFQKSLSTLRQKVRINAGVRACGSYSAQKKVESAEPLVGWSSAPAFTTSLKLNSSVPATQKNKAESQICKPGDHAPLSRATGLMSDLDERDAIASRSQNKCFR